MIAFLLLGYMSFPVLAQNDTVSAVNETVTKTKDTTFNAGKFVIEHVTDAYEWHIVSFKNSVISVPLPVILYSKNSGLHVFLSSRFHHGKDTWEGFKIAEEGKYEGKIVELNKNGEIIGRPIDVSITKTAAGIFITAFILLFFMIKAARLSVKNKGKAPSGFLNLIEPVILFVRDDIALPSIGEKKYKKFLPILLSLFFFILLNNLIGLIPVFPFGSNVTGNIAITMVLALFTFFITNFNGNKHYWKEIFNPDVPWWMKFPIPLMPFVEFFGLFTKPLVLMIRLFANMLAGHMIVTVFVTLIFIFSNLMGPLAGWAISPISILFSVFILILDILVAFIQAYVFTLLSAIYFGMATEEHH